MFLALQPTNDQISSHSIRLDLRSRSAPPWYTSQAAPMSSSRRMTVSLSRPVIRQVARMELPSTSADTMAARSEVESLFTLPMVCLSGQECQGAGILNAERSVGGQRE